MLLVKVIYGIISVTIYHKIMGEFHVSPSKVSILRIPPQKFVILYLSFKMVKTHIFTHYYYVIYQMYMSKTVIIIFNSLKFTS